MVGERFQIQPGDKSPGTMRVPIIRLVAGIVLLLAVAACDSSDATPTSAYSTLPYAILPASPTINPILPTLATDDVGNLDVIEFTPGAPAVSTGDLSITVTPTPLPTVATMPMQFTADDGLVLVGTYYVTSVRPAPTVLLLPTADSKKDAWTALAQQLQVNHFNVLALDMRGSGETGGKADWGKASQDVVLVISKLAALNSVNKTKISVVGAAIGANVGMVACAATKLCDSIILISPTLNDQGVGTASAMAQYGKRPVLIVSSSNDVPSGQDSSTLNKAAQGDHQLVMYQGTGHGTELLTSQPDLIGQIIDWLARH